MKVTGNFKKFDGKVVTNGENFDGATAEITVYPETIDTRNLSWDNALKEPNFFNVKEYPEIKFSQAKFTRQNGNQYKIEGELTIKGVPRQLTAEATLVGEIGAIGSERATFLANTQVNRFQYDLRLDDQFDQENVLTDERVSLMVYIELVKE